MSPTCNNPHEVRHCFKKKMRGAYVSMVPYHRKKCEMNLSLSLCLYFGNFLIIFVQQYF